MRLPTTPIGTLMTEHRLIIRVVNDMRRRAEEIASGHEISPSYIDAVTDFLRTYTDECHHGKEEDILFRQLAEKPLSPELGEMMQQLIEDHRWARTKVAALVDMSQRLREGDASVMSDVGGHLAELAEFYPRHIETEDHTFFKPAMEYFDKDERAAMEHEFEQFDRAMIHAKYARVAEDLEAGKIPLAVSG